MLKLYKKLFNGLLHKYGHNKIRNNEKNINSKEELKNFFLEKFFCNIKKIKKVIGKNRPNILKALVRAAKKENKITFLIFKLLIALKK